MTDFTQQLRDYEGELIVQREVSKEKKKKLTKHDLTLQRCAKFALLDVARFIDGRENPMNSAESMYKRYKLMKRIDSDPKNVELSKEEKEILTTLLPLHYDVVIVGQIMDLL